MNQRTEHDVPEVGPSRIPTRGVRQTWNQVHVEGMAVEVPTERLLTAELEERMRPLYARLGFKAGWVEAVTGIAERRLWKPGVTATDGATAAARTALAKAGVDPREVQVVVSCSVYKPRLEPSIACEIQDGLGIGSHCANFDVGNACLGFLTGMATVANMIELGQIDVGLVVAGEDARPVLDATLAQLTADGADIHRFKDHLATLTLGSAATAMVLTSSRRSRTEHRLLGGASLSAAEQNRLCHGDAGGMVTDSVTLLREGVALASRVWAEIRDLLRWRGDEIDTFAMHQVGKAHHETILAQLGVTPALAPRIYPWLGNIGSCGVPVTLTLAQEQGHFEQGQTVSLMGIGSGLNCAMMGVRW